VILWVVAGAGILIHMKGCVIVWKIFYYPACTFFPVYQLDMRNAVRNI
jgi:hypothetical protein